MSSYLAGGIATLDRWEGLKEWHRRHQDLLQDSSQTSNFDGYRKEPSENNRPPCKDQSDSREHTVPSPTTAKHDLSIIPEADEDSRSRDGDLIVVKSKQRMPKNTNLAFKGLQEEIHPVPTTRVNGNPDVKQKSNGHHEVKRPFLRRGQGLARYNLHPEDVKHPYRKGSVPKNVQRAANITTKPASIGQKRSLICQSKRFQGNTQQNVEKNLKGIGLTAPMERLVLTVPTQNSHSADLGTWSQVFGCDLNLSEKPFSGNSLEEYQSREVNKQEMLKEPTLSNEQPVTKALFSPSKRTYSNCKQDSSREEDQESLAAYLDLEQHVGNASFCSTSSKVDRLIEKSSSSTFHQSNPDAITQSKPLTPLKTGRKFVKSSSVDYHGMWSATELENLVRARARRSLPLVKISLEPGKGGDDKLCGIGVSKDVSKGEPALSKNSEEKLVRISPCEPSQESQNIEWLMEDLDSQRKPHLMKTMPGIDLDSSLIKNALAPTRDFEDDPSEFESDSSCSSSESSPSEYLKKSVSTEERNCAKQSFTATETTQNAISSASCVPINDINLAEINNQIESHLSDLRKEIETLQLAKGKTQKYMQNLEKKVQELEHRLLLDARSFNKRLEDERAAASKMLSEEQARFCKERQALQKTIREQKKKAPDSITHQEMLQLKQEIAQGEEKWRTDRAKARGLESNLRIQISNLKRENEKLREENNKLRREKDIALSTATAKAKISANTRVINSIAHNLAKTKPKVCTIREDNSKVRFQTKDSAYNLKPTPQAKIPSQSKSVTTIEKFPNLQSHSNEWSSDEEIDLGKETSDDEDMNEGFNTKKYMGSELQPPKVSVDITQNGTKDAQSLGIFEHETVDLDEAEAKYDAIFGKNANDLFLKNTANEETDVTSSLETSHLQMKSISPKGTLCSTENFETEQFVKSIQHSDGKIEQVKENGTRVVTYPDGTWKRHSCSGSVMTVPPSGWPVQISYFNGDQLEKFSDGTTRYFYAKTNVWQTTFPDGHEELLYPSGQVERREQNGSVKVLLPNSNEDPCVKAPNFKDSDAISPGITAEKLPNGDTLILLPNGERELHTKDYMKKDFLDGTVKFLYKDGSQETQYPSGRIRVKDSQGNLVKDTLLNV